MTQDQIGIFRKSGSFVRFLDEVKPTRNGDRRLLRVARVDTGKEMLIPPESFDAEGSDWDEDTRAQLRKLQLQSAA